MERGEEQGDDEGSRSIGKHATGSSEDDEPRIAASVIDRSDAEFIVKPFDGHEKERHSQLLEVHEMKLDV